MIARSPMDNTKRSFLKWAGSKYNALSSLESVFSPYLSGTKGRTAIKRLVEPFAGSATVSLNFQVGEHLIADGNADIINLYRRLAEDRVLFIDACEMEFSSAGANTADGFYQRRAAFNSIKSSLLSITAPQNGAGEQENLDDLRRRARLFVYLNRHCFNGLCRYNSRGEFNVPFGKYKSPMFPRAAMMDFLTFVESRNVTFVCADFQTILNTDPSRGPVFLKDGDLVYADPPYAPLEAAATFTSYIEGGFGTAEQLALAEAANHWADHDIPVLISNHDTNATRDWYKGSIIHSFDVSRTISSVGAGRKPVRELIAEFTSPIPEDASDDMPSDLPGKFTPAEPAQTSLDLEFSRPV